MNQFLANPAKLLFLLGVGFFYRRHPPVLSVPALSAAASFCAAHLARTRPPFYGFVLVLGAVLSVLIVYKLAFLRLRLVDVFGETMMLVYYGYALPLSLKIGRGFYEDGIWADAGFIPYSRIGGLTWRRRGAAHAGADLSHACVRARGLSCPPLLRRGTAAAPRQDRRLTTSTSPARRSTWECTMNATMSDCGLRIDDCGF